MNCKSMFHFCRTFSFSGVYILYLKSINDQKARGQLWGFVVSTTFFADVIETESKYCASDVSKKKKEKSHIYTLDILLSKE